MFRSIFVTSICVALLCSASLAGVVVISRSTSITASGATSDDSFNLSDNFDQLGPYDEQVDDSIDVPAGGTTRAEASQQSSVNAAGSGWANGFASAQVAEFDAIAAAALSEFLLVLDIVNQSEPMSLNGSIHSTFDAFARVAVIDDATSQALFEVVMDFGEEGEVNIDRTLTLSPGRYRLLARAQVTGTPTSNGASFAVNFETGGGAVIPLPAGVWAGALMLVAAYARSGGPRRLRAI